MPPLRLAAIAALAWGIALICFVALEYEAALDRNVSRSLVAPNPSLEGTFDLLRSASIVSLQMLVPVGALLAPLIAVPATLAFVVTWLLERMPRRS